MGLQFNLKKGGVSKPDTGKSKIKFAFGGGSSTKLNRPKLPHNESTSKKSVLAEDSDSDDEGKIITIKGFDKDKGGVLSSDSAIQKTTSGPVVITLKDLSTRIRRKTPPQEHAEDFEITEENSLLFGLNFPVAKAETASPVTDSEPSVKSKEERIRQSLIKGEKLGHTTDFQIPVSEASGGVYAEESTRQDYDAVPVEQFGAALLRGMGWKGQQTTAKPKKEPANALVEKRQRSVVLGIGAKPIENELVDDIFGKKGLKFEVPLVRRNKETGEVVLDTEKR